jgi:hypothetical protein
MGIYLLDTSHGGFVGLAVDGDHGVVGGGHACVGRAQHLQVHPRPLASAHSAPRETELQ